MKTVIFNLIFLLASAAQADSYLPYFNGCPSGYDKQANSCVKRKDSKYDALVKNGTCPPSYQTQGRYCVSSSSQVTTPSYGSCPSGFQRYGAYCQKP